MSFFDELTKKAKAAASTVTEKTKEAAETARISAAILAEKREMDKNYRAIGQWYVCELEGDAPAAVADLVAAVKASQEKIEELEASKAKAEESVVTVDEEGEVVPTEEEAAPEVLGAVCPVCGKISESRFCPHCGAPMGE